MVDFSEDRNLCPSVSFFFARLGAFLETSSGHRPYVGLFVSRDSLFKPILTDLYPLLHQSLNWYCLLCAISVEEGQRSVVRSSEMETNLSSSDKPVEMEIDTATSKPSSSKPSMLLTNHVVWTKIRSLDSGIGSNFPTKLGFVFLTKAKELRPLPMAKFASTRLPFCAALGSLCILS